MTVVLDPSKNSPDVSRDLALNNQKHVLLFDYRKLLEAQPTPEQEASYAAAPGND